LLRGFFVAGASPALGVGCFEERKVLSQFRKALLKAHDGPCRQPLFGFGTKSTVQNDVRVMPTGTNSIKIFFLNTN
jgi:hypothetical protein